MLTRKGAPEPMREREAEKSGGAGAGTTESGASTTESSAGTSMKSDASGAHKAEEPAAPSGDASSIAGSEEPK